MKNRDKTPHLRRLSINNKALPPEYAKVDGKLCQDDAAKNESNSKVEPSVNFEAAQNAPPDNDLKASDAEADKKPNLIAIGTFLLSFMSVAISAGLYCTSKGQLDVMQGQLSVMEDDQRPWMQENIKFISPFEDADPDLLILPIDVTLVNVGHSPAFGVLFNAIGYVDYPDHDDPSGQVRLMCKNIKALNNNDLSRGRVVMSGDRYEPWNGVGGPALGFMQSDIEKASKPINGSIAMKFLIVGCTVYQYGKPLAFHETGFVYQIYQTVRRSDIPSGFDVPLTNPNGITAQDLTIKPYLFSNEQIN